MIRLAKAMARKDLTLVLARGNGLAQALLLGLLLIFVFSLSREAGQPVTPQEAATVFWLSSAFCQVLVFNRLFALEETGEARLGLLLLPAPIQAVWLGKAIAGFCLLLLAQVCFLPAAVALLGQDLSGPLTEGALALLLVDLGLCAVGALLGALATGQGARESLLSVLFFPLQVPLLLAGIKLGAQTFGLSLPDGPGSWLRMALAFDGVFLGAGLLLFGFLYSGDA
ncbi:MAG: heme exporter protein CcmB [Desulfovibrio sp.]|nr:heme exporter protein CcmB [Desulfovibrio sp.]